MNDTEKHVVLNLVPSNIMLTEDQEQLLIALYDWLHSNQVAFSLKGYAGTGKTFVLQIFKLMVKGAFCVSAPTHKAVNNIVKVTGITGMTLHALHGLKPNLNLDDFDIDKIKFDSLGIPKIQDYKVVAIDEASMIAKGIYALTIKRALDNGVKILFIGDPCQLNPVKELTHSAALDVKPSYTLTKIVRQDDDNPLRDLLLLAREDVLKSKSTLLSYLQRNTESINSKGEGYKVVNRSTFEKLALATFLSDEFDESADHCRVAVWKNDTVRATYNLLRHAMVLKTNFKDVLPKDSHLINIPILDRSDLLIGYKTVLDQFLSPTIQNSSDFAVIDTLHRMSENGYDVYLTTLRNLESGNTFDINVVNHRSPSFLLFTEMLKAKYFRAVRATSNRGDRWKEYFKFKEDNITMVSIPILEGGVTKVTVQNEIDYGYALTTHKL